MLLLLVVLSQTLHVETAAVCTGGLPAAVEAYSGINMWLLLVIQLLAYLSGHCPQRWCAAAVKVTLQYLVP
jgi:hypothetical protein